MLHIGGNVLSWYRYIDCDDTTNTVECYNPKTGQWTMCAPMKERRYRPGVAVVDGKIYVLGGEEGWDR